MKKILIISCLLVGTTVATTTQDKKSPDEQMQELFKNLISGAENNKKVYEKYNLDVDAAEEQANLKFLNEMQKQHNALSESERNIIKEKAHKVMQEDSVKEIVVMGGAVKEQPFGTLLQTREGAQKVLAFSKETVDLVTLIGNEFNTCIQKGLDSKDTKDEEIIPRCTSVTAYLFVNMVAESAALLEQQKADAAKEAGNK